jgi:hypothetical protein
MNLDDESLLSAYLDGQLDPDQQQVVESALLSNPQLSEQLRALTIVRALVGGLSRDTSVDVSSAVLERIRPARRRRLRIPATIPWFTSQRRALQAAGLLAIAATMIIVCTVALNIGPEVRHSRPKANSAPPAIASNDQVQAKRFQPIAVPSAADSPKTLSSSSSQSEIYLTGAAKNSDIANSETNDVAEPRELEQVRKLLDSPQKLQRFFLVQGGRDGAAGQLVANVVQQTAQHGFYKITISHGIVIDPRHPDEATVFALLVSPKELDNLKKQLSAALPDAIEETPVDPGTVTQLADIGQVQASPAFPIVTIPQDAVALRVIRPDVRENGAADIQPADKRPTAEQEQSAPVPPDRTARPDHPSGSGSAGAKRADTRASSPARSPEPSPGHVGAQVASHSETRGASPEKPEDLIVVLVWVTRRPSG